MTIDLIGVTVRNSCLGLALGLALVACGGGQPAVATPEVVTPEPPPEPAEPEGEDEAAAEDTAAEAEAEDGANEAGDSETAEKAEPEPPPRRGSGRPAIQYGPSKKIATTFGSTPAALLRLKGKQGAVVLKIPEFALRTGTNITWQIAKRLTRGKGQVIGSICELLPVIGTKTMPEKINSDGPPFEFRFPTMGRSELNLAIGEISEGKFGRPKVDWTVYAPKRIDTGFKEAYFEIPFITHAYVHATTAAPTAAP